MATPSQKRPGLGQKPKARPEPIQTFIQTGLAQVLAKELEIPMPQLSLVDNWGDITRSQEVEDRGRRAGLRLEGFQLLEGDDGRAASGGMRAYALQSEGVMSGRKSQIRLANGGMIDSALRITLVPVLFRYGFMYGCFDGKDIMYFMSRWAFTCAKDRASFQLRYLDNQFPVGVKLGKDLAVPTRQERGEDSGALQYEGSIEVLGWMTLDDARDLRTVPFVLDTKVTHLQQEDT